MVRSIWPRDPLPITMLSYVMRNDNAVHVFVLSKLWLLTAGILLQGDSMYSCQISNQSRPVIYNIIVDYFAAVSAGNDTDYAGALYSHRMHSIELTASPIPKNQREFGYLDGALDKLVGRTC
jgi:hypothetical protein